MMTIWWGIALISYSVVAGLVWDFSIDHQTEKADLGKFLKFSALIITLLFIAISLIHIFG